MKLEDITKDLDKFIEERIDYIFKSFQKIFAYQLLGIP